MELVKFGNSLGVRVPSALLKQLNWFVGMEIEPIIKNGSLVLDERREFTLETLLKEHKELKAESYNSSSAWDDEEIGKEVW